MLEIVIHHKLIIVLPASGWAEDVSCCELSAFVEGKYRLDPVCLTEEEKNVIFIFFFPFFCKAWSTSCKRSSSSVLKVRL